MTATFFTGKPCRNGHLSPRRVIGNICIECNDEAVRRYRAANREKTRAYARSYAKAFPEKVRASQAEWYARNPAKETARKLAWTRANAERHSATSMRRHARKLNAPGRGVTADQRQEIMDGALGLCAYCNERKKLNLDHIEPLARGGAHDVENVIPACKSCNSSKGDTPLLLWLTYRFR